MGKKTFKKCLPIELSGFAYTAFHNAWVSNGLIIASEDIEEICEYSYNRNKINSLRPDLMKRKAIEYGSQNELEKKNFFLIWLIPHGFFFKNEQININNI